MRGGRTVIQERITGEMEPPKRKPGWERPGDSTMSLPELGAIEREAEKLLSLGPFLEVGIYHCRTTVLLAQVGPTTAVDWFRGNVELAPPERRANTGWSSDHQWRFVNANLDRYPGVRANVNLIVGSSEAVLPTLERDHFSLILLDAAKEENSVLRDIEMAWPLLKRGGTFFMDDWYASTYDETVPGTVKRAWTRFAEAHGLENIPVDLVGFEPPTYDVLPKLARLRTG